MTVFILAIHYFVFRINDQTQNTPGALVGGLYILGCFAISFIVAIIIAYTTRFKNFKKIDILLFVLCTPLGSALLLLLVKFCN